MYDKKVTLTLSDNLELTMPLAVFKPLAKQMDEKTVSTLARLESMLDDKEREIVRYRRQHKVFDTFLQALINHCHLQDDEYFTIFDNDFASTKEDRDKLTSVIGYFINAFHANREGQEEYIQRKGDADESI